MATDQHIIDKAIELRKNGHRLVEICEMLGRNKSTVSYWLKDIEKILEKKSVTTRTEKQLAAAKIGSETNREKHRLIRKDEYLAGYNEAKDVLSDDRIRDFINLYIGEGDKKPRAKVSIVNADIFVIKLSYKVMRRLSNKSIEVLIRYYKDKDPEELKDYWKQLFGNDNVKYTLRAKDKQTNLAGSNYANKHGLVSIEIIDTYLKCRINAYMDYVKNSW